MSDLTPPESKAASARYGVRCPTCGTPAYWPCRSRRSIRVTDTHASRINAAYAHESEEQ